MSITVRFFASLRERLGCAETRIESAAIQTVADVWMRAANGAVLPPNVLAAVNHDYARLDQSVKDGDEVAFFPPVTGGTC
jgi:molybdopterin synthase sulfur carrier subunit